MREVSRENREGWQEWPHLSTFCPDLARAEFTAVAIKELLLEISSSILNFTERSLQQGFISPRPKTVSVEPQLGLNMRLN